MNDGPKDLCICVTDDRLTVYLECPALDENLDPYILRIKEELEEKKIVNAPPTRATPGDAPFSP